jgi:RHS repeat-associated protein
MTDAAQTVVWDRVQRPFGQTETITGSAVNNLRFPGQYFDAETGTHYNTFRDCDPSLGRYLESDPIGLAGGLNTYAYVGGNPINYTDPDGLFAQYALPVLIGAATGAAIDIAIQAYDNGGSLACLDYGGIGQATLLGGAFGGGFAILGRMTAPRFAGLLGRTGTGIVGALASAGRGARNGVSKGITPPASAPVGRRGSHLDDHPFQPNRNPPGRISDRDFSGHSLDRMQDRGITPSVVENVIKTGRASPGNATNTTQYYDALNNVSVFLDNNTGRILTVRFGP